MEIKGKKRKSPFLGIMILSLLIFLVFSLYKGNQLVKKTEKEVSPELHKNESNAKSYELKEIDSKTGDIRWKLTAKEGSTQNELQGATIRDIEVTIFKNKEAIFNLKAPIATANSETKEILLLEGVTTKSKGENFILQSNKLSLAMGTELEAFDGFKLSLKNNGTLEGERAEINEEQTKIRIKGLKNAALKDIKISGKNVYLEKDNDTIKKVVIKNGGQIVLMNNDVLSAEQIEWINGGTIKAKSNVIFTSTDKQIKAGKLLINTDNTLIAEDKVTILDKDTKCSGEKLIYHDNQLVEITGEPKALQGNKIISADKILYDTKLKKLQAIGSVKTSVKNKT